MTVEALGGRGRAEGRREESVAALLEALATARPSPAGGSAAAFVVAMAAALTRSVAQNSAGSWSEAGGVVAQVAEIERRVVPLFEEDAEAYQQAVETLIDRASIPPDERDARLGEALERAADLPLRFGDAAADMAELAAFAAERSDHIVRADAIAAASLAAAAAEVAAVLVEVNLATTAGDPRIRRGESQVARARAARERALRSDC